MKTGERTRQKVKIAICHFIREKQSEKFERKRTEWLETSEMNDDHLSIEVVRGEERKGGNAIEGAREV